MGFTIKKIPEKNLSLMKQAKVWQENCPIHHSRLKLVEVSYWGFDNEEKEGEIIVLDIVSEQVCSIFESLYRVKFSIEKIQPIEDYEGNDVRSMEANNSSSFNGRKIANTNKWSSHAYGVAIDINPVQNPYLKLEGEGRVKIIPETGITYVNRNVRRQGMVEEIVPIFAEFGFTEWGGNWTLKPDFHHFQLPWSEIESLFQVI